MALKYGLREMAGAFALGLAYGLVLLLALASLVWRSFVWAAVLLLVILVTKHWIEGIRESDPLWYYRGLFRPIEGFASLYGLLRGLVRYGIRRPTRS